MTDVTSNRSPSREYREKCIQQKGEECWICSSDEEVEVHHIDGNPSNNRIENLIPVCNDCHISIHMGESGFEVWTEKLPASCVSPLGCEWSESKRVTIRVPINLYNRLEELVETTSQSRSTLIRFAIDSLLQSPDELEHLGRRQPRSTKEETNEKALQMQAQNDSLRSEVRMLRERVKELSGAKAENEELREEVDELEQQISELEDRLIDSAPRRHIVSELEENADFL